MPLFHRETHFLGSIWFLGPAGTGRDGPDSNMFGSEASRGEDIPWEYSHEMWARFATKKWANGVILGGMSAARAREKNEKEEERGLPE
jgi:hypothetical protein